MDAAAEWIGVARSWLDADPYAASAAYNADSYINSADDVTCVTKAIPGADKVYSSFELDFDAGLDSVSFAQSNILLAVGICVAYVVSVFTIKAYMRDRKFIDVRRVQFCWNSGLALFSLLGALRMVPHLLLMLYSKGLRHGVCSPPTYGEVGPSGLWTMLFVFSKVPELGDTFFIVLGKRDLMFLHWYHHVTVLLFSWNSYGSRSSTGVWFIAMNFTVHAFMYQYFALMGKAGIDQSAAKRLPDALESAKALRKTQARKNLLAAFAPLITSLQIGQMVVGMLVHYWAWGYMNEGGEMCYVTRATWSSGLGMYASYFVLFALFAINRYCPCGRSTGKKSLKVE